jgi:hypothetical protein
VIGRQDARGVAGWRRGHFHDGRQRNGRFRKRFSWEGRSRGRSTSDRRRIRAPLRRCGRQAAHRQRDDDGHRRCGGHAWERGQYDNRRAHAERRGGGRRNGRV